MLLFIGESWIKAKFYILQLKDVFFILSVVRIKIQYLCFQIFWTIIPLYIISLHVHQSAHLKVIIHPAKPNAHPNKPIYTQTPQPQHGHAS